MKKILILQLARLGDILISAPLAKALKRQNPGAEVHFLVRSKFQNALNGHKVDKIITLDTPHILQTIVAEPPNLETSMARMNELVGQLEGEKYDWIINLSFSRFSSYLTEALSSSSQRITGYSRHSDGFLSLPDDVSRFFHAQVGVGKSNRVHLFDIFAAMVGVEYSDSDWNFSEEIQTSAELSQRTLPTGDYIVVHVGASSLLKSYDANRWRMAIQKINDQFAGQVILIGAANERAISQSILRNADDSRLVDWVGETQFEDLMPLIKGAKLLIGCDSAPIHIASLTQTPTLNLSFSSVNFWETGPRAPQSRVLYADDPTSLTSDRVAEEALNMLQNLPADSETYVRHESLAGYTKSGVEEKSFAWELIQAIYMEGVFPRAETDEIKQGLLHFHEITQVAFEQLEEISKNRNNKVAASILEQTDQIAETISKLVPDLAPIVNWQKAERICVGPQAYEDVYAKTREIYTKTIAVIEALILKATEGEPTQEVKNGNSEMVG
jgi:heptosyltransferase-3